MCVTVCILCLLKELQITDDLFYQLMHVHNVWMGPPKELIVQKSPMTATLAKLSGYVDILVSRLL